LRIGELHEQRTRDLDAALAAYARAVEDDPENTRARAALAELAATRDSYRQRRAQVLRRAVDATTGKNASVEAELLLELSVLLDQYLSDPEGAERAYERLIELDPGNADVVLIASRALERIHIESGSHAKLAVDLRRQVELETDPPVRARLLVRLALLLEETHGTLLDHISLIYGAGIADSNSHSPMNIPVILAGGGAGNFKGGRHIAFKDERLANLHLTLLDQFGIHRESLGDSTGRVDPGLLSLS
jgi:tetratricopeptide (TPR) repeat protein